MPRRQDNIPSRSFAILCIMKLKKRFYGADDAVGGVPIMNTLAIGCLRAGSHEYDVDISLCLALFAKLGQSWRVLPPDSNCRLRHIILV